MLVWLIALYMDECTEQIDLITNHLAASSLVANKEDAHGSNEIQPSYIKIDLELKEYDNLKIDDDIIVCDKQFSATLHTIKHTGCDNLKITAELHSDKKVSKADCIIHECDNVYTILFTPVILGFADILITISDIDIFRTLQTRIYVRKPFNLEKDNIAEMTFLTEFINAITSYHGSDTDLFETIYALFNDKIVVYNEMYHIKFIIYLSNVFNARFTNIFIKNDYIYVIDSNHKHIIQLTARGRYVNTFTNSSNPTIVTVDFYDKIFTDEDSKILCIDQMGNLIFTVNLESRIISLCVDDTNLIHFVDETHTVKVFDPKKNNIIHSYSSNVKKIVRDNHGNIYISQLYSIAIYTSSMQKYREITRDNLSIDLAVTNYRLVELEISSQPILITWQL